MQLTDDQLSEWQVLKAQFDADADRVVEYARLCAQRQVIRPQIVQLLESFLSHSITVDDLRSTWDVKTRTQWNYFGLKGLSSAMVLNMLVKHLPDQKMTSDQLTMAIRAPKNEEDGRKRMAAFHAYLEAEIRAGHVARRQMQTARIPYFLSAFWHLQATEAWPMFFVSARQAFLRRGLQTPKGNVVDDYFAFRDVYLSLMRALNLNSWDLEQLCWFDTERRRAEEPKVVTQPRASTDEEEDNNNDEDAGDDVAVASPHTHAQWLLASIGKALGCKIWIAANDHNKVWSGQRLGEMSIPSLPRLGIGSDAAEKIVRLIDVLWLKGTNQVVASFEIEHSTSVYSGLLRMADLTVLSPNIAFPLYIVAPETRLEKVRRELSRASLQTLELHQRCGFFSIEALTREAEPMMKWAKQPEIIDRLAEYVKDLGSNDEQ